MSQCSEILAHMKTGNSITAIDALNLYGCFRLAARIKDLRSQGHDIHTRKIKRNGKEYAEYRVVQVEKVAG